MSTLGFIITFISAVCLSFILTALVRKLALKMGIVDQPGIEPERRIHSQPISLLGGLGIFLTLTFLILYFTQIDKQLLGGYLLSKHLWGVLVGGLILIFGGYLDDRYHLSPSKQIIFPILAALTIIISGITVEYITNPFGEAFQLDTMKFELFSWDGLPYSITLFSDLFIFIWLMGMMYTTKFLDGLDGLASGITTIGALIIFFLSMTYEVGQPETALLALIFAGAGVGFLIMNFHPAKIFLGEGGSVLVGFMLGVLAIISGAKVATALLIMGIPILDVIWVIIRRLFFEKKSPVLADKKHLHFRLLDIGMTQRQAVVFLYVITAAFGVISLFFTGKAKVWSLVLLAGVMLLMGVVVVLLYKKNARNHARIDTN